MFKKFKMDYDLSKKMYDDFSHIVKMKECYSNVAQLAINHITFEKDLCDIKIAFGAWQVPVGDVPNMFAKHCFFLFGDKVVDPTHFTTTKEKSDRDYLIFKTFNINDYLTALDNSKCDTYLPKYTEPIYRKAFMKMMEDNIILLG